ncbi:MAG: DNA mismatch repair endonuclease MutL [Chromatiales bacterium]|nr:DNA mismatch repair endonuclease MutL [Chromatiales bacterium]
MSSPSPQSNPAVRRIRQLPVQLANQIAAGEVIERPASVVKELVENSIDAGSTQIDIAIERGGTQLIQISDNGHGIATDDLVMALSPHATSKVYNLEELNQILSLGFRGEALASIASVSRTNLQSRQADSPMGWMVTESLEAPQPCAIPPGSRIVVRELFFNTPGRKRFLRTERTEFLQIESMVRRLALSHFDIGFSLGHNGKSLFHLPVAKTEEQQLQRIGQLFGKAFVDSSLQVEFEAGGMLLSGWVGTPDYSISQSDRQYFFLNGRGMRDKVISHAIRHVYQGHTPEGRSPSYLLNLEIDPEQVDVNVHPTKQEVRFRQGRMVHDFLTTSLMRAFEEGGTNLSHKFHSMPAESTKLYNTAEGRSPQQINEVASEYQRPPNGGRQTTFHRSGDESFSVIAGRYLLFIVKGEHYLCDLPSISQRVVDEHLAQLDSGEVEMLASQPLLFPEIISTTSGKFIDIKEKLAQLSRFGITLEPHGEQKFILRSLPLLLSSSNHRHFIEQLVSQWDSEVNLHQLIKQSAASAVVDVEDKHLKDSWLKPLGLSRVSQLVAAKETIKLDGDALEGLFR